MVIFLGMKEECNMQSGHEIALIFLARQMRIVSRTPSLHIWTRYTEKYDRMELWKISLAQLNKQSLKRTHTITWAIRGFNFMGPIIKSIDQNNPPFNIPLPLLQPMIPISLSYVSKIGYLCTVIIACNTQRLNLKKVWKLVPLYHTHHKDMMYHPTVSLFRR